MGNDTDNGKSGYPPWVLRVFVYERRIRRTRAFGILLLIVQISLLAITLWSFFRVEQYLESLVWAMVGNSCLIGAAMTYEQTCKTNIVCSIAKHAYMGDDTDIKRILDM